jgi:hypothetical protein
MALKALSRSGISGALLRTLNFAQRYSAAVDFAALDRAGFILDRTHAFADPNDAAAGIHFDPAHSGNPRGRRSALRNRWPEC